MSTFSWLPIAAVAYLIAAVTATVDRAIVHKELTRPIIISFWVALFSVPTAGLVLFGFLPFDFASNFKFELGANNFTALALLMGFLSQLGHMFMYRALKYGEVTRVVSVLGGLTPIVSFIASYIFLGERLGLASVSAFVILLIATIVLTINPRKLQHKSFLIWVVNIIFASLIFGSVAVLSKYVYDNYHFISAYSITGIGALLYILAIALLSNKVRGEIAGIFNRKSKTKNTKVTHSKQVYIIFGNSMLGGVAVIMANYAINLGSPTLVGSMRGVQYAGIFLIALVMSKLYPKLLAEDLSRKSVILKSIGIILTISGIALLTATI